MVAFAEEALDRRLLPDQRDDDLTIACGEGALRLLRVQRAGSKSMAADELLKGFALPKGTRVT